MTQTPPPWQPKRIDQVCNLGRGRVISQEEIRWHSGVYPVYSSQSKDDGVFGYLDDIGLILHGPGHDTVDP